jgi:DUF1365 family protein
MAWIDVDRLAQQMSASRLLGYNRAALAAFYDADHFGDPAAALRARVVHQAAEAGFAIGDGPIYLLTHLRYAGYVFNPISLFYCYDQASRLRGVLAEVNNTFGGRQVYWLNGPFDARAPLRTRVSKELYVSPFMPFDMAYDFTITPPAERLVVHMSLTHSGASGPPGPPGAASASGVSGALFDATLRMRYRPWNAYEIHRALLQFPFMTAKVIGAIHWEALRLWLKGLMVHPFPVPEDRHRRKEDTDAVSRLLGRAGRLARARWH